MIFEKLYYGHVKDEFQSKKNLYFIELLSDLKTNSENMRLFADVTILHNENN